MCRPIHNKWSRKEVKKREREREELVRYMMVVEPTRCNRYRIIFLPFFSSFLVFIFSYKIPLLFSSLISSSRFVFLRWAAPTLAHTTRGNRVNDDDTSPIIIIIIIIYISGFFTGLARSSLRAIDEGEKTTRAMASLFYYVSVWLCAHTHNTYRGSGPLVLTQSPAQQRPSVGRQHSNCSQRTSLISLLRLSFFGKFFKFQDLGPKNRRLFLLKIVCCFRVKRSVVFCVVSFQSSHSMEWNPPVQV